MNQEMVETGKEWLNNFINNQSGQIGLSVTAFFFCKRFSVDRNQSYRDIYEIIDQDERLAVITCRPRPEDRKKRFIRRIPQKSSKNNLKLLKTLI